jgi:hypothetical protein
MREDPLAKIHKTWRDQCIKNGTYRPFTEEELQRVLAKWREIFNRPRPPVETKKKGRKKK